MLKKNKNKKIINTNSNAPKIKHKSNLSEIHVLKTKTRIIKKIIKIKNYLKKLNNAVLFIYVFKAIKVANKTAARNGTFLTKVTI